MWYLCLLLLLLHPLFSMQRAVHTTPSKSKTVYLSGETLGAGEACGVYTFRCGHGLKCVPPVDDPRQLRALLEGRGQCGNASNTNATEASQTTGTAPTDVPEQAPCRKLLTALLSAQGPQLVRPQQEIYLPNCALDGFFKKKQCWSSRGKQRGKCWCVDKNGTPLISNSTRMSAADC